MQTKVLTTSQFESGGERLVAFGLDSADCGPGSFTFWKAIMSIDGAEEFAARLTATIAEAKAARDAAKPITEAQPDAEA